MDWGILLLVLLVLVCPISMMLMMRGRHRMHGGHRMHDETTGTPAGMHEEMRDNGARGPVPSTASQEARLARLQERQDAVERKIEPLRGERQEPGTDRQV